LDEGCHDRSLIVEFAGGEVGVAGRTTLVKSS